MSIGSEQECKEHLRNFEEVATKERNNEPLTFAAVKKVLAICICLSLLAQCVAHLGVWGYYKLNKDYIARFLCENRSKPEQHCSGKCYLRKQLNRVSEHSDNADGPGVKTEKTEIFYLVPAPVDLISPVATVAEAVLNPTEKYFTANTFIASVFHPPALC